MFNKPKSSEYPSYFENYISKSDDDVLSHMERQRVEFGKFISNLYDDHLDFRYAEGKWSLREVLVHINDTERIFAYRALCISRSEKENLPNFDQDKYLEIGAFDHLSSNDLADEFDSIRKSSITLIKSMTESQLNKVGSAAGNQVIASAIPYMIVGHLEHHRLIINQYYLQLV